MTSCCGFFSFSSFRPATVRQNEILCSFYEFLPFLEVTGQSYQAEILNEYVILGNDALLKCNIPSFVADFVGLDAWVTSAGDAFYPGGGGGGGNFGTFGDSLPL